MKDLLITVYGGGEEAVEAAATLAGLRQWVPVGDGWKKPVHREIVLLQFRHPDTGDNFVGLSRWHEADGWVNAPRDWLPMLLYWQRLPEMAA
jgi:hypothetical protein